MHLLDLGDNGLEVVFLSPELSLPSLARLASVCRGFRATLSETAFLRRLATAHGFSDARAPGPAPMPTEIKESFNDDSVVQRLDVHWSLHPFLVFWLSGRFICETAGGEKAKHHEARVNG